MAQGNRSAGPVTQAIRGMREAQRIAALRELSHQITVASGLIARAMWEADKYLCVPSAEASCGVLSAANAAVERIENLLGVEILACCEGADQRVIH